MVAILLLAAGQSSRMRGADKLTELIDGTPLLQLQADRALATGQPVYVAIPDVMHPRAAQLEGRKVTLVPVLDADKGMAHSLRAGLAAIAQADAVLICLADLVAIRTADLQAVLSAQNEHPKVLVWRGATQDGLPGHPILISPNLRPEFAALRGDQGGADVLKRYTDQTQLVRLPGNRARLDLDTPEDWAAWRAKPRT